MAKIKLTKTIVDTAQPQSTDVELRDTLGSVSKQFEQIIRGECNSSTRRETHYVQS